ncbi:LADA_0D11496g1_1 [Lachancea dasiensis]|uniref:LADA_0D11496g1_1 n=1 Tax=Lachancea dasiensis TaxID=1072105 RepID=A0A1G4J7X3_9SACH|nr:LADA_0D11496g1_1 [Lachancea dasiensis]
MTFTKLVIAGSTGLLADEILPVIINSTKPKFDVTLLTHSNGGRNTAFPDVKTVSVDYNDHKSLVRAVAGADAIISLVSVKFNKIVDLQLLRAAQDAGVRRIFPSEYTIDVLHPAAEPLLKSDNEEWRDIPSPANVAREFLALAEEEGPTSFTTLVPSTFIDHWLRGSFGMFEPKAKKIAVRDGGNHYFTGCSLPFIAASLLAVLQMDEESTKNKRIHISEVRASLNEITDAFEEVTGDKFERIPVSSESMFEQRKKIFAAGDIATALYFGVYITAFNGCGAGDLKDGLLFDGDGYLRLERRTLKDIVSEAVQKA